MDERDTRLARNEALFREVNERVDELAGDHQYADQYYLCECANPDCTFQVQMTRSEYESVRSDPARFFVLPGHYTPEIENLVTKNKRHWVVEKVGPAADYVKHLDPRSR